MSGGGRSRDCRKRTTAVSPAKATVSGCFAQAWLLLAFACLWGGAAPAAAQTTPSFSAAAAYNMQPGTVPIGVATGVFNVSGGGLLDFAVLEQVPNSGSYQVEIFHGKSDGTFYTNLGNANPNPDVIPLGSGVKGTAIAVGQFRAAGPLDIAVATVATNSGIVFLENNDTGTFTLSSKAITTTNGFAALTVGQFNGDSNLDIAAVTPTVSGSVSFTVFFGDGTGAFPTHSSPYAVSSTYAQCTAIMPGNFQGQTSGSDLALACNNASFASVLVYLNSGSGAFTFTLNQTLNAGNSFGGTLPGVAVGTLNKEATIFISPISSSFISYQGNGLAGSSNSFTSVSMIPVGLAPRGPLAVVYNSPTGAVDFAAGPSVSTFTSYSESGTSVNGTWNSTASLGPTGQALATGSSNLTQGTTYVVVDAGTHSSDFANPNVSGPPNFEPYLDERSIGVYLATLNGDGTVASTNTAPVYAGTGLNGYAAPPVFATGDFNGDGKMDLAVGGANLAFGDPTLTIYLANANGSLPVPPTTSLPILTANNNQSDYFGADAVVGGKFRPPQSGKTLYDLAVFSFGQIFIFTSNGDGSFNAGGAYSLTGDLNYPGFIYNPASGRPFAPVLTATDVNGDGFDDIVLTLPEDNCKASGSASQGAVYLLLSNGDGTFQSPVFVAPPVDNPVSAPAAKFFGSSFPDLVFANGGELCKGNTATTTANAVGILRNQVAPGATSITAANFTAGVILTQTPDAGVPNVTAVASADLNGDGHPDLVVSSTNGIQVLLNSGTGAFSPTTQGVVPLYAGDVVPGPLCSNANNYVGCVTYDSQVATGSFFASGETDVAAAVNGVVYIFQNNSGTLVSPTQGFVAGPSSGMISAALAGSNGLNSVLVATSQGTAYVSNSKAAGVLLPPTIGKAFGAASIALNGTTSLTFTITNPNTDPSTGTLTGVEFTDNLPAGLVVATPNGLSTTCQGGVYQALGTVVQWVAPGFTLAANSSCTLTANVTGTTVGVENNSVTVTSTQGAGNTANASVNVVTPLPPTINMAFGAPSIPLNGTTSLTFTITNPNTDPSTGTLTGVEFTDNLPAGLVVATPNGLSTTCQGGVYQALGTVVQWVAPGFTLAANSSCTLTANVTGTTVGVENNSVTLTSTQGTGNTANASVTVIVPLPPAVVTDNETITVNDTETFPDVPDTETIHVTDTPIVRVVTPLTVTANNTTRTYGAANPNFTGTVTGALNGDSFVETFSTTAIAGSPVGTYPITPTVSGTGLIFYAVNALNGTLTITQAGTSVQLSTSANGPVVDGTPVILTANVASATTGTPTGTVTFLNGSRSLGAPTLSQGVATLTISTLPLGTNIITATYSGDANFAARTSPALTLTVNPVVGPPSPDGYWLVGSNGAVYPFGDATDDGSVVSKSIPLAAPIVGMAATSDGGGYWLVGSNGAVLGFGDARYLGDCPQEKFACQDIVGMAATPDGAGYWLAAANGGVFGFGDARYHGSCPDAGSGCQGTTDIVGIAATPDGGGYWLAAANGGVFGFGDAHYHGSCPDAGSACQGTTGIVGMAATPDGGGYWLAAANGGVFGFGDAHYHGSCPDVGSACQGTTDIVGMAVTPDAGGYWLVGSNGGVFGFGNARFLGNVGGSGPSAPIVGIATTLLAPSPTPDYTVGADPDSITLAAGQSNNGVGGNPSPIIITVTPVSGYIGTVSFSCGKLPVYITCTFNPAGGSVTFGSAQQDFISAVYRDLLNRDVDPGGLAFWTQQLNNGGTDRQVALGVESTTEYDDVLIGSYYQTYLHRAADSPGLNSFVNLIQSGGTDEQVQADLLSSPEYFSTRGGGTNAGFVAALYLDLLNRPVDSAAMNFENLLSRGILTRAQIVALILGSSEYLNDLVNSYYSRFLHRSGAAGAALFANELQQGVTDETVISQIVGSPEFFTDSQTAAYLTLIVGVASTSSVLERSGPALLAMIAPLGLLGFLPLVGKQRKRLRLCVGIVALALSVAGAIAGCSSAGSSTATTTTTLPPAGMQSFTVTAAGTSGVVHPLNLTLNITN